jgi:hypothetical protein
LSREEGALPYYPGRHPRHLPAQRLRALDLGLLTFTGVAIISSLLVAALLANLALHPIELISLRLDTLEQAGSIGTMNPLQRNLRAPRRPRKAPRGCAPPPSSVPPRKTPSARSRTRSSASAAACATSRRSSPPQENLDSIMANLQDGILLPLPPRAELPLVSIP